MSIFFYQIALAVFPIVFLLSFLKNENHIKNIFVYAIFGFIFGLLCFSAFAISSQNDNAKIFFDIFAIAILTLLPLTFKFTNLYFLRTISFLLAMIYGYEYRFISANFPIFASELLDSLSLLNLFMVCFGIAIFVILYFILKLVLKNVSKKMQICFFALILLTLIIDRAGFLTLEFMQEGKIKTYPKLLSIIAKIIYFNGFLPILFSIFAVILSLLALFKMPKKIAKDDIVKFRENKAIRTFELRNFIFTFILTSIISIISLFYINIASKPPKIDNPILVEPKNGEFRFDANIVLDNKLHRYAYIMDDGHKVRFLLLNRFPDKLAPVATFDACSICGDMGYVKKGDELICISCNVRIFLPSVGKAGGCNPIPFNYKFDGKEIIISLKDIESGASFFSEVVEKMVTDPVSRKQIKNNSKFSYLYYGRTYFFENEKNQAEFEKTPEKFVETNGVLKELK